MTRVLLLLILGTSLVLYTEGDKKVSKRDPDDPKEVLIVGGGIAGLAAARKLTNHNSGQAYKVTVLEGRRDRYGGRIWTNRKDFKGAKGVEAELGCHVLNPVFKDNPLLKILNRLELKTQKMGKVQLHVPAQNKVYSGDDVNKIFMEFLSVLQSAVDKVRETKVDRPIREALEEELQKSTTQTDKAILMSMLDSHHTMSNKNFSAMSYNADVFNSDTLVPDGFDQIIDGIVGGFDMEESLSIDLRKTVRQIEINKKKQRVFVRTKDLVQYEADIVIIALPAGVLQSKQVQFEPPLPKEWYKAINNVGVGKSNLITVEFDEIFWPEDVGIFSMVASSQEDIGLLEGWINLHGITGKPILSSGFLGEHAVKMESMTDEEIKETALRILTKFFGEEKVKGRKITRLLRSQWIGDVFSQGCSSYVKAGTTEESWKVLEEPVCPHIYFAGGYTDMKVMNSGHGAYMSGIRAADQVISGDCETKILEMRAQEKRKKKKKDDKRKKRTDDDDDDEEDDDVKDRKKKDRYKDEKRRQPKKNNRKDEL